MHLAESVTLTAKNSRIRIHRKQTRHHTFLNRKCSSNASWTHRPASDSKLCLGCTGRGRGQWSITTQPTQPTTTGKCQGAIAIENWSLDQPAYSERLSAFSHHAHLAMAHAVALESIPMVSWGRRLQKIRGQATARRIALPLLGVLGIASLFVIRRI